MTREELRKKISDGCGELGQCADDEKIEQFATLLTELEHWGMRVNLTAIRNIEKMVSSHLLDSLAIRPYLQGDSVIDIGTGAGFHAPTPTRKTLRRLSSAISDIS